jgi:hypothetical protein
MGSEFLLSDGCKIKPEWMDIWEYNVCAVDCNHHSTQL